jgi:hypothetical protein
LANEAYSDADSLLVGAGILYFKRKKTDGTYDNLHFMGNCDEFTVTSEATTIEKNSSMDAAREMMASVNTAIKVTGGLTMTEYDSTNLALGFFGTEGIHTQEATTLSAVEYTVPTVPGLIKLEDSKGNSYYNVTVTSIAPSTSTPASIGAATMSTALGSTGTVASGGTFTGTTSGTYYVKVDTAPTASGNLAGMVVKTATNSVGPWTTQTAFTTGTTTSVTVANGVTTSFTVTTGETFAVNEIYTIAVTAASGNYVAGTDYELNAQRLRGGIINIPAGSSMVAGSTIRVTATIPAGTYPSIAGGNAGEIEGQLLFLADNNNGGNYNLEGWRVKVTPNGDIGLIGTEFSTYKLNLKFEADKINHPTCPYYKAVEVKE